jgi:hypothetical protein
MASVCATMLIVAAGLVFRKRHMREWHLAAHWRGSLRVPQWPLEPDHPGFVIAAVPQTSARLQKRRSAKTGRDACSPWTIGSLRLGLLFCRNSVID